MVIAQEIQEKLLDDDISDWVKFNPIAGFLNIQFKPSFLFQQLEKVGSCPEFLPDESQRKIILEYVSANPTGPLHIGHGRWAVLGSAIVSLLRYTSHQVSSEFYINDAGNQVDLFQKSVEALRQDLDIPEEGYHGAYVKTLAEFNADPLTRMLALQKETLCRLGVEFDTWFSERVSL